MGRLCTEKKAELGIDEEDYARGRARRRKSTVAALQQNLKAYRDWLLDLKICDPACGSGAFLNEALNFLIEEHDYVSELERQLFEAAIKFEPGPAILERNLYGVDINEEAVEIAKLSLWLRTAERGRKLADLSDKIKVGNSLIDDVEVAGEKAFTWAEEFPEVFGEGGRGGFDVVVGNPPYVFARENFSDNEKAFFSESFSSAKYQVNTYMLFMERSTNLLAKNALLSLIVPDSWLMVYSGEGVREFLLQNTIILGIANLPGESFSGVAVETVIVTLAKDKTEDYNIEVLDRIGEGFVLARTKSVSLFADNERLEFAIHSNDDTVRLLSKIIEQSIELGNAVVVRAGLQAYEKGKGTPKQSRDDVKQRPYDFSYKANERTYPYLEGGDVKRYGLNWSGTFLQYGDELASPRSFDLFAGNRIIIREITSSLPYAINAAFTNDVYLFNRSNIGIQRMEGSDFSLIYALGLINSKLMSYYFMNNTAKSTRKMFPKLIINDLSRFPVKQGNKQENDSITQAVESQLCTAEKELSVANAFLRLLSRRLAVDMPTRKLEDWPSLSYVDFVKKVNKVRKKGKLPKLTAREEMNHEEVFLEEQAKVLALRGEIERLDREIDVAVYRLYGLTWAEVKVVDADFWMGEGEYDAL